MSIGKDGKRREVCRKCGTSWNVSINRKISKSGYVCPKCRKKRFIRACVYILLFILGAVLCKIGVEQALIERGRFAVGGEWLLPVLFVGVAFEIEEICTFFKDFKAECKKYDL